MNRTILQFFFLRRTESGGCTNLIPPIDFEDIQECLNFDVVFAWWEWNGIKKEWNGHSLRK